MDFSSEHKKIIQNIKIIDEWPDYNTDLGQLNFSTKDKIIQNFILNPEINSTSFESDIDKKINELWISKQDFVEYIKAIYLYQHKKDYSKSIEIFQYLQSKYPNITDFLYYQWQIYLEFEMFDDAIACFKNIIEISPNDYGAMMWIGNSLMLSANYDQAILYYQKVIEKHPDKIDPKLFIWVTENLIWNHKKALQIFKKIKNLNKKENLSNYEWYTYFLLWEYDNAERLYLDYLKDNPKDSQSLYMLWKVYNQKENYNKSRIYLDIALEKLEETVDYNMLPDILFELWLSYFWTWELKKAIEYFDWVISIDSQDIDSYIQKAECLLNLWEINLAKETIKKALLEVWENDLLFQTLNKMQDL